MISVEDNYQAKEGEVLFPDYPTESELQQAFPNRLDITREKETQDLLKRINQEVNAYIFSRYDAGTQMSFAALYAGPGSTVELRTTIESVWDWSREVLEYYYTAKSSILSGKSYEWDLSQFDATDPMVMLNQLIGAT